MKLHKMINLIRNENLKLSRRISTWLMFGVLILLVLAGALIIKANVTSASNKNWRSDLTKSNIYLEKQIKEGRFGQVDSMKREVEINNYRLAHNIPPINLNSLWGFVENLAGLISLIALFAIVMGGGMVANEFSSGTIKLLLIRPSKRWKILLSKYITVLSYILFMLVTLFAASFIIGGLFFSFNGATEPFIKNSGGVITQVNMIAHIASVYGYECVSLIMMVTLAFMISTVFRSSSLAIGIGVFLMFIGTILVRLLSQFDWSKYILFANTNLRQYTDGNPPVKGMTLSFSIIVLIAYFIIFTLISFVGFTKRDVAA